MFQRILCGVDFSEASTRALQFAERMAREMNAELILVHAFDVPAGYDTAGQKEPHDARIRSAFDQITPVHPDLKMRRALHVGPPGEVLCWLAEDQACDVIVIGTHGRGGLSQLLLGSVAQYVVRHARRPVIVVRDVPPDEPPPGEPKVLPVPAPQWM
jgi:nucleotide-binding universal stress UspA family protein